MLRKLSLTNWRKHPTLTLAFTPGLNLVVGSNWSGKSSALSAIPFALFGVKATPGTAADLTTFGETDMRVELEFEAEGKVYTVTRGLKSATLTCDGVKKATGNSPVTAEIEHLIGMSMRSFLDFNVTSQGEADAFLSAGSAKLADYVARVTGTDVVDTALDRIKGQLQQCEGALSALPATDRTVQQLEEELREETSVLQGAKAAHSVASREADQTALASQESSNHLEELREAASKTASAQTERAVSLGVLREAQKQLAAANANAPLESPARPDRAQVDQLVVALTRQKDLRKQIDALQEKLTAAGSQIQILDQGLAGVYEEDPTAAEAEAALLIDQVGALTQAAAKAGDAYREGACPTCHRPFGDESLGALSANWEAAEASLAAAQEASSAARAKLKQITDGNAEIRARDSLLRDWIVYEEGLLNEIDRLNGQLPPPVDQGMVAQAQEELRVAEEAYNRAQAAQQGLAQAEAWVAQAKQFLDAIEVPEGPTPEGLKAAEEAAKEASARAWKALQDKSAAGSHQNMVETHVSALEQDLSYARHVEEKRAGYQTRRDGFTELQKFLRANRDRFTAAFWDQLLGYASTMIQEVTSGDVTRLSRNAAGDFTYTEHGREIAVEGSASGMQRAIFSTAIKLSLAAASGCPFPVMLFDEVTAAAQDAVSLQFTSLLAYAGKQVVMVTHRPADAAAADTVIDLTPG